MKGYFTVETSLILPMVLAVQVFLIYAMLRQYDRCLLEQDMGILTSVCRGGRQYARGR